MKERRISHVPGIELAITAARRAIACAGMSGKDIELVIYGSCSNDETVPNSASGVQQRIGADTGRLIRRQYRLHQFHVWTVDRVRNDQERHCQECAGDRRRADFPVHGLGQSQRGRAVRRRRSRRGAAGVGARSGRHRREAAVLRRRAANPARARHGHHVRQSRRAIRTDRLGLRRPGNLSQGGARHERGQSRCDAPRPA